MSQYTMQYGGAGTGRAGSLLTPLLPRIAVGATHSSTLWHGSREQAMLCHVCGTHQGRRQYILDSCKLQEFPKVAVLATKLKKTYIDPYDYYTIKKQYTSHKK